MKLRLKPNRYQTKYTVRGAIKIKHRRRLVLLVPLLLIGGLVLTYKSFVSADSTTTVPVSDITTNWATSTGTTHYALVDEGATPNTSDYVHTGTGSTASITDEYGLAQVPNVASASQLVLNVYAEAATIGGGTADTLSINLKVSGTLQTAGTCTPGSGGAGIYAWCTATFTGSWTQTNVNNMSVVISNTILGSGPGSGREDDIRVASIYGTLTYVSSMTKTQASYRLFNNVDASGQSTFARTWGGGSADGANSIIQTSDGGYATTGYTDSFGAGGGGDDMVIAKYDNIGALSWSKTWGNTNQVQDNDIGYSMVQTSDGGYAVTGITTTLGDLNGDMFIAKYTSTGTFSWSKTWGNSSRNVGRSIIQTSDGGYAITGETAGFGAGSLDMFIAKYTSTGTLSWSKTWGGSNIESGAAIIQTSDGGYAVAGQTATFGEASDDAFIAKYTSTGTLSWSKTWGGTVSDIGTSLVQTSDGGYIVSGYSDSFTAGDYDMFIAKYTSTGTLSWSKTWGGSSDEEGHAVVQATDGGYVVTGYTSSFGAGGKDSFLAKFTSTGTLSWSKTWGGSSDDIGNSIVKTSDGGYAVAGQTASFGVSSGDVFITKYDTNGNITGCASATCKADTVGGGSDYTSTSRSDGTDYTSTNKADTVGGGSGYTSVSQADTVGGGSDYTSTNKTDGTDYTSIREADTVGGGSDYTSTTTLAVNVVAPLMDVGSALATQNTAASITGDGTAFRLRMDVRLTGATLSANAGSFKLQYALRGADNSCDTSFSGETYADVTDTSTVHYYDNPAADSGLSLASNANDPTDGANTLVHEIYLEKGTTVFTNPAAIPGGQDGVWDFALTTNQTLAGQHYCMRIINSGGTNLDTYAAGAVAEIGLPSAPTYNQAAYRWYTNADSTLAGGALTTLNSSYNLPTLGTPVRLRALIGLSNTGLVASGQSFKLQYAQRNTSCDVASYSDVTATSPIQWYDNPTPASGAVVTAGGSDPADGANTVVVETYQEANNLTNPTLLYSSQDGMWDFSLLIPTGTLPGSDFCLRIITSAGATLDNYGNYPEIQYGPRMVQHLRQGKWFDGNGVRQPYFLQDKR